MRLSITAISLLAAVGSAAPLDKRQSSQQGGSILDGITSLFGNLGGHTPGNGGNYPTNSGGTGGFLADLQVPADHIKYTITPSSAEEAIPAAQNSQMREGHRIAHVAIYKGLGGN
ncbi:uncharacterized protein LMH87_008529 [Akanthomyces muscarius]|uniref:Uncharacterized protein n=2 Tax=Akanthomyces TaxID=150366 RepID=A0A167ZP78_CORDF|nr:uncharacterized protein LMH87_008529 [Akanthomyces muscarius]KAJ4157982.1 hypothetical protein LMH87_008529 [Akanthomyces muscarius]OAA67751.1 hypothetical protein LEL_10374 [Akanthomyces lecanii RCEF 1005]